MNPGGSSVKLAAIELSRYRWAANLCQDKNVLDYGCGHGHGAEILAQKALKVTGYDIDKIAIEYARFHYPKIRFVNSLFYEDRWFDTVVCLEVIEHVDDGQQFLDQIKKLLRPMGQLLLSTPNRFYTEKHGLKNPYHLREYSPEEMQQLLIRAGFSIAEYSQPHDENIRLDKLAPITPMFVKKMWRRVHRVTVKDSFSKDDAVQLYQCWLRPN